MSGLFALISVCLVVRFLLSSVLGLPGALWATFPPLFRRFGAVLDPPSRKPLPHHVGACAKLSLSLRLTLLVLQRNIPPPDFSRDTGKGVL